MVDECAAKWEWGGGGGTPLSGIPAGLSRGSHNFICGALEGKAGDETPKVTLSHTLDPSHMQGCTHSTHTVQLC